MWKLLGKLLLLGAARRWAKRPTAAVETAALVLVLNERRLGRGAKRDALVRAAHIIFLPAAVIKTVRLIKRLRGGRLGLPPGAGPASDQLDAAATDTAAADPLTAATSLAAVPTFRHQQPPLPRAVPRSEWGLVQVPDVAAEYAAWAQCVRNVLAQQGLRSLPPGLDPDGLELVRYLLYNGLLAATKPAEAARAVAATAVKITGTHNWRSSYPFMGEQELKDWEDVAWWVGPDPDGTMWLHLHLQRAVARCGRGEGRKAGAAVISQLEYGTRVLMTGPAAAVAAATLASGSPGGGSTTTSSSVAASNAGDTEDEREAERAGAGFGGALRGGGGGSFAAATGGGGRRGGGEKAGKAAAQALRTAASAGRIDDRIRVVIVGSGSNVRQALRALPLMREFACLVQRHYPGRLRAMYLVDMPRGLRMGVGAILNLLSAETRQKIKVCRVEDLPDCISTALISREAAQQQQQQQRLTAAAAAAAAAGGGGAGVSAPAWRRLLMGSGGGAPVEGGGGDADSVVEGEEGQEAEGGVGAAGRGHFLPGAAAAAQLVELRVWLLRALPALLMLLLLPACLTYKSMLARP